VDLRDPLRPRLLRPGQISRGQIEAVLRKKLISAGARGAAAHAPLPAPGLLARHYSPRTPLVLHKKISATYAKASEPTEAWLFFARPRGPVDKNIFWLDASGDPRRAARRLFGLLRTLDGRSFKKIHAELAPGHGLAEAINDRLRRAAGLGRT